MADFGSVGLVRISGHDLPHPAQRRHRRKDQTTSGQADEGERPEGQNDERNSSRNKGEILIGLDILHFRHFQHKIFHTLDIFNISFRNLEPFPH